jgi:hypothetical protein
VQVPTLNGWTKQTGSRSSWNQFSRCDEEMNKIDGLTTKDVTGVVRAYSVGVESPLKALALQNRGESLEDSRNFC